MKKIAFLSFLILIPLLAQAQEETFQQANKDYVLYEVERDKNSTAMYDYLLQSYKLFVQTLEMQPSAQIATAAKAKLVAIYPILRIASVHYSNSGDFAKAYPFGLAYVKLPTHPAMVTEILPKDPSFNQILFNTGATAVQLNDDENASYCLNEYLASGETARAKDCYNNLIIVCQRQKDNAKMESILKNAIQAYPNEMNYRYNLVNHYIATRNNRGLLEAVSGILDIDPNNLEVLPMKARLEMSAGNLKEAQEMYKRIYNFRPDDFVVMRDLAICDFKIVAQLNQQVNAGSSESDKMRNKQESYPYVSEARILFEKMLEKQPQSYDYMKALGQCYLFLGMSAESAALNEIVESKGSYNDYAQVLSKYNQLPVDDGNASKIFTGEPPKLITTNVVLREANNNNVLDGGEAFTIEFTVVNQGNGDAENVHVRFAESGLMDTYITGIRNIDAGTIPAHSERQFTMNYTASETIPDGTAAMTIYVLEGNSFDADPQQININVQEMARPRLRIAASQFMAEEGTAISLGDKGKLILVVQNYGSAMAYNTEIKFDCPDNILPMGTDKVVFDTIPPGGNTTYTFDFLVNKRFAGDSIPIHLSMMEDSRYELIDDIYRVKLGDYLSTTTALNIDGQLENRGNYLTQVTLKHEGELFTDIPVGPSHLHRYALIIGNELYSTLGNNSEINVPYAENDASAFKEYCLRTFGIPYDNIIFLTNATTGQMIEAVDRLIGIGKSDPQAELMFYYSGHGSPDEQTQMPYLLPVDLTGKNVRYGISLNDLYSKLSNCGCMGAYVFLDACFSGGFKSEQALIAAKGVRIAPKYSTLSGNTVSFTSSSGDQTSSVFHEKKHGIFTYFLLKSFKDSNGDITFEQLYNQTRSGVFGESSRMGKPQSPQVIPSEDWSDWSKFKLNQ